MRYKRHFARLGVAAAVGYWLIDSAMDAWIFRVIQFPQALFPPHANEWWMRLGTAFLLIGFGIFAEQYDNQLLRSEQSLHNLQARIDDPITSALSGSLVICAQCKSVRNGDDWIRLETYVTEHTGVFLSHGLCPNCAQILSS